MPVPAPQLREAIRAFALGEEAETTVLKDDEDSLVLRIGTEAVLKQRRRLAQSTKLETEAQIVRLNAVAAIEEILSEAENEVLCPAPLPSFATASGDRHASRVFQAGDGSLWTASRFIANEPVYDWLDEPGLWNDAQASAAGLLLSRLHRAGAQVIETIPQTPAAQSLSALVAAFDRALRLHDAIMQELAPPSVSTRARANIERSLDALSGASEKAQAGLVHGDFHPGNVLFAGQQALCVIDLDYAHRGEPLFDVAYACITFGEDRAQAFLNGYFEGSPTAAQSRKLELLAPQAAAWIFLWCLDNWQARAFAGRLTKVARLTLAKLASCD